MLKPGESVLCWACSAAFVPQRPMEETSATPAVFSLLSLSLYLNCVCVC